MRIEIKAWGGLSVETHVVGCCMNCLWKMLFEGFLQIRSSEWTCWIFFVLSSWQTLLNVYLNKLPLAHELFDLTHTQNQLLYKGHFVQPKVPSISQFLHWGGWKSFRVDALTYCMLSLGAKTLETEWNFTSHLSSKVKWILFIRCHREQSSVKSKNLCILRISNSLSSKACWQSQLFCKMSDFEDEPGTSVQIWIFCHFRLISSLWQDFIELVLLQFEDAFFACYVS